MNIQILDSWLREYLHTKASPKVLAQKLSLSSVSIEHIKKTGDDYIYDIEVTTNRPDLMSVVGIAREASAVLPQVGIDAQFTPPKISEPKEIRQTETIEIKNDPSLVNRICAVVLDVHLGKSPAVIQKRLESSGIRSLNNVIDVTNYVMREMGHPAHVFDYDRLSSKKLVIRLSKKGERITTLDGKEYPLPGNDIVADDGSGQIVDLIGIMGLENSVVTTDTKRVLFFIDNNKSHFIRKTSMSTAIRTEAAVLNEKNVDPQLAYVTLLRGIELYKEIAEATVISKIIDIYPNKITAKPVTVSFEQINRVIGVEINPKIVLRILQSLDFSVKQNAGLITVLPPTSRAYDIRLPEDIIEEVARVYGYYNIPSVLPPIKDNLPYNPLYASFYWEERAKRFFKYLGWTETYTYSMIPENLLEVSPSDSVKIANPLNEELVYMRTTLVPSLLEVLKENKIRQAVRIFEIAKTYHKNPKGLPFEKMRLAGVLKEENASFFHVKGLLEQLFFDLGVHTFTFSQTKIGGNEASILLNNKSIGGVEILETDLVDFELDFETLISEATHKKTFEGIPKFPPVIEDISLIAPESISYEKIVSTIKVQSPLIRNVQLLDSFHDKKTFRIEYLNPNKNLTTEEVAPVREQIYSALKSKLHAKII